MHTHPPHARHLLFEGSEALRVVWLWLFLCVACRELLVLHTKAEPKPGSPLMTLSIKPLLLTAAHKAPQCLPSTLAEVCVCVVNSC
jgi:hypothetical protein